MATSITIGLIYTRVSGAEQGANGLSLDSQLDACRRYIAERGWLIGGEHQDILSGMRDDRPAYQQLLAEVRRLRAEGRSVAVVVSALDRFGRRMLERLRAREELKKLGVPTHSVRDNGEVSDLVANVLASVAEEEARLTSVRVRETRQRTTANGWAPAGRAVLGYRRVPAKEDDRKRGAPRSVLVIDPERAPLVRELFGRLDGGESVRSVARYLAGLPADVRGHRRWSYRATRLLFDSRTFVGQLPDGTRGNWKPLVDLATFNRVQARIAGHKKLAHNASGRYLLSGLLRCPNCGGRMAGAARARGLPPRYRCSSRSEGKDCRFSAATYRVDDAVMQQIVAVLEPLASGDPALKAAIERGWKAVGGPSQSDDAALRRGHEQAADKARQRIRKLALLYADGELDRTGYDEGRTQAASDLEAAETALANLRPAESAPALPPLSDVLKLAGGWREVILEGSTATKRELLGTLIETIVPERVGYARFEPRISWTPTGALLMRLAAGARVEHPRPMSGPCPKQ